MASDLSSYPKDFGLLMEEYNRELAQITSWLEKGTITAASWEHEAQKLIAKYATAAWKLGSNRLLLSPQEKKRMGVWLDDQYKYLEGLTAVISSAGEYNPALTPRAQMYGTATYTQYWEGKTEGLALPAHPAQGTQCLSNCRCTWRIEWIDRKKGDADCYWELNATENCQTCVQRHADWYPVRIRGGVLTDTGAVPPEAGPAAPPKAPKPPKKPKPVPTAEPTAAAGTRPVSGWRNVLSEGRKAVTDFPELRSLYERLNELPQRLQNSVGEYTGPAFYFINSHLRHPGESNLGDELRNVKKYISHIDEAFRQMPPLTKNVTVVRGGDLPMKLKVGEKFSDDAYVSTSVNRATAIKFMGDSPDSALFVIDVPKGKKVLAINGLSGVPDEEEVLLPRGTVFTVKKVEETKAYGEKIPVYYLTLED